MTHVMRMTLTAVALACGVYARADTTGAPVPFPTDYRTWTHVKSTLVGPTATTFARSGGLHHYYANAKAVEGYKSGTFPDGAVLVDERLAVEESNGIGREGARHTVSVMVKDRIRYADTDGWGYAVFQKDDRTNGTLSAEATATCRECHTKRKDRDYVFTTIRP